MARKKKSKPAYQSGEETRASFTFASLHDRVIEAVDGDLPNLWFYEDGTDNGSDTRYSTYVGGRFECSRRTCGKGSWTSWKVAIVIRKFDDNGYNAEVFNQHCRACNSLGSLLLYEETYISRVSYRLKKWAGILVDRPAYKNKESRPHRRDLCEGCKRGVCGQLYGCKYR